MRKVLLFSFSEVGTAASAMSLAAGWDAAARAAERTAPTMIWGMS
jgi:hypothetical protein